MKTPTRTPEQIRRRLRQVNARLSDFAADLSEYGRLDAKCGKLARLRAKLTDARTRAERDLATLSRMDSDGQRVTPAALVAAYAGLCRDPEYVPNLKAALEVGVSTMSGELDSLKMEINAANAAREAMRAERSALQSERAQLGAELKAIPPAPALVALRRQSRKEAANFEARLIAEAKAQGEAVAKILERWEVAGEYFPVELLPGVFVGADGVKYPVLDWGGIRLIGGTEFEAGRMRAYVAAIVKGPDGKRTTTGAAGSPLALMRALGPFF